MPDNDTHELFGPLIHMDSMALTVCMFILCIVGLIGNIVSLIVFNKPSMRSSINVLLAGLSALDLAVLILSIPLFVIPGFLKSVNMYLDDATYTNLVLYVYPLTNCCQTCSIWTFVLINVERYLAICRPFLIRNLLTIRRVRQTFCVIFIVSFVYNTPRFWEYQAGPNFELMYLLKDSFVYYVFYHTILYLMTHMLVPLVIILVLNLLSLRAMAQARKLRQVLSKNASRQARTTHMIVAVTVLFGVCNVLPFVLNIWEAVDAEAFATDPDKLVSLLTDISNALVLMHSSITVFLYSYYIRKYRIILLVLIGLMSKENDELEGSSRRSLANQMSDGISRSYCKENSFSVL